MQDMLKGAKSTKASEEHYSWGMHYQSQMVKPAMDRPKILQNSGQNTLKLRHKNQEMHAHSFARKQGTKLNFQTHWKSDIYESMTEVQALKSYAKWWHIMQTTQV